MAPRASKLIPLILVLSLLAACAGEPAGPDGSPEETSGSSRVLLTDDPPFPFARLARVDIYVVSVSGSLTPDTGAAAGGFVTLAAPHRTVNVLALRNGLTDQLGSVDLPRGAITAVRMVIDTDSSSITLRDGRVLTGSTTPGIFWQSSAGRPVLNAFLHEQIAVPDSGAVVVIEWDLAAMFYPLGPESGFIFMPQLRAVDATRTGAVTGTVRARSASGAPVPDCTVRLYLGYPGGDEGTWPTLATTTTDSAGAFSLSYVTRSSWWASTAWAGATYIVAVDPPSTSALGRTLVPNVTVEPREIVNLGTIALP